MRDRWPRLQLFALSLCLNLIACGCASASEIITPNTLRLGRGQPSPPATIDDMAWYAGVWRGTGLGGSNEEIWSAPQNGTMMGMYRLLKADGPVLYEFLTIVEEHESLALHLKHFNPDMKGWEDRDESVQMPLVEKRNGRIYFDGLTFEPHADGTVTIFVAIRFKDDQVREEAFTFRRQR